MKANIITIALLAVCCLPASAAAGKDKSSKNATPAAVVDTISVDSFSYALGKANTMGLKEYLVQRMGIDTTYIADFLVGFDSDTLTEADKKEKARLAGVEIRTQVENQIIPQMNKQINDSIDMLGHDLFVAGFRTGVSGQNDLMPIPMDSTQAIVKKQMDYYHQQQMEAKYGANRIAGEEFLKENATKDSVVVTESGLQYKILTAGTGEIPTATQKVKVNYRGTLLDGTEFDSSYKRNQPATLACNQVIKGWSEALTMMPVGSKWMLYIPQELAYGDRESGKIPPFSTLIFEVELVDIV
ncbi:MAG: FKBP-type peptidyl-prolyl cis-trans isomerase, partial [Prevotellaceae bacterium]|nr:FKBP-type peptidyl-prolyl cis-trans isomerase [Prevotellaceae bacterium]